MSGVPSVDVAADASDQEQSVEDVEDENDRDEDGGQVGEQEEVHGEARGEYGAEQYAPYGRMVSDPSSALLRRTFHRRT
jgi:hypothetical protein